MSKLATATIKWLKDPFGRKAERAHSQKLLSEMTEVKVQVREATKRKVAGAKPFPISNMIQQPEYPRRG